MRDSMALWFKPQGGSGDEDDESDEGGGGDSMEDDAAAAEVRCKGVGWRRVRVE